MIRALLFPILIALAITFAVAWSTTDEYSPTEGFDVRTLKHCIHVRWQSPGICPGRWCDAPASAGYAPGTMVWRPACLPWSWPL